MELDTDAFRQEIMFVWDCHCKNFRIYILLSISFKRSSSLVKVVYGVVYIIANNHSSYSILPSNALGGPIQEYKGCKGHGAKKAIELGPHHALTCLQSWDCSSMFLLGQTCHASYVVIDILSSYTYMYIFMYMYMYMYTMGLNAWMVIVLFFLPLLHLRHYQHVGARHQATGWWQGHSSG